MQISKRRDPQPNDNVIEYTDMFLANEKQLQNENPCVLFSIYNSALFRMNKNSSKKAWDSSFEKVRSICKERQEFCKDMQEFEPITQYVNEKEKQIPYKIGDCKNIADFFQIINSYIHNDNVKQYYGIAFLVGTFASAILIDNVTNLIHIRDSHIIEQYTVNNTSDLYKHLLLDKYFSNVDKEKHSRPKIKYVVYRSTISIVKNKPVIALSRDELIMRIYDNFNANVNDASLITGAVFGNQDEPLKARIGNYMKTNEIKNMDLDAFYLAFRNYANEKLGMNGGKRDKNKYDYCKKIKAKALNPPI